MLMKNDPGVSLTKEVINRCKANDRCVSVLTMPDRMKGYCDEYNDIFQKRAYKWSEFRERCGTLVIQKFLSTVYQDDFREVIGPNSHLYYTQLLTFNILQDIEKDV